MSTRGVYGFRIDGKDKLSYNHFDSYPNVLGLSILEQARQIRTNMDKSPNYKATIQNIRVVSDANTVLTDNEESLMREFVKVPESHASGWGDYYTEMRGNLEKSIRVGVMLDGSSFINESLFCEWGYIINIDENVFEVYQGFQQEPHRKGRYGQNNSELSANLGNDIYYPCALVKQYSLCDLPTKEVFLQDIGNKMAINEANEE